MISGVAKWFCCSSSQVIYLYSQRYEKSYVASACVRTHNLSYLSNNEYLIRAHKMTYVSTITYLEHCTDDSI